MALSDLLLDPIMPITALLGLMLGEPTLQMVAFQGYSRSFILRYVEEAMSETIAKLRISGFSKAHFIDGAKFPIGSEYKISWGSIGNEARQICLGPIIVAGMTFQVWANRDH